MFDTSNPNKRSSNAIPWWVTSIILLSITGVICYKVIITPFNLQFDFSSLLSLTLALFSVALAAMFYFKATDTSNAFYDNTYKFTREIASILVKIESGFGEKLTHLDDSYKGMRDRLYLLPGRDKIQETEKVIKQEEGESKKILTDMVEMITGVARKAKLPDDEKRRVIDKILAKSQINLEYEETELQRIKNERTRLIDELTKKASLTEEEKEKFIKTIQEKENAYKEARKEIEALKQRVSISKAEISQMEQTLERAARTGHLGYMRLNKLIEEIGGYKYILSRPLSAIIQDVSIHLESMDDSSKNDLKFIGFLDADGGFSKARAIFLRSYAQSLKEMEDIMDMYQIRNDQKYI